MRGIRTLFSFLIAVMLLLQTLSDARALPAAGQQTLPQQASPGQQPSPGGIAAGPPQKAEFDSEHRPITAGGFVKTGPVIFVDDAEKSGLATWRHKAGTPEKRLILEAKGAGVALLDYDNDGWLDIFVCNYVDFSLEHNVRCGSADRGLS